MTVSADVADFTNCRLSEGDDCREAPCVVCKLKSYESSVQPLELEEIREHGRSKPNMPGPLS